MASTKNQEVSNLATKIHPIDAIKLGHFTDHTEQTPTSLPLQDWSLTLSKTSKDAQLLLSAATALREDTHPIAFPTETVYGLGADATRSAAVRSIYAAKRRPADNPLIVHIASITQLEALLSGPVPPIYHPLLRAFWPGPLTIILPVPSPSPLAKEVTAGLPTFGARMPANLLALALIKTADRPIAAPSANASTRPSPTAAEHVLHDLDGRIETILDAGPCDVGVESTVVDGLCDPPCVLRPGGISIGQLRSIEGWEGTVRAYKDKAVEGDVPRAPGMKYRHYSPRARVVLFEAGAGRIGTAEMRAQGGKVGVVRTGTWEKVQGTRVEGEGVDVHNGHARREQKTADVLLDGHDVGSASPLRRLLLETERHANPPFTCVRVPGGVDGEDKLEVWDVHLGPDVRDVARGLFSALREMDRRHVDVIFIEGVDDTKGEDDVAAAVMNRLRKAAEVEVKVS